MRYPAALLIFSAIHLSFSYRNKNLGKGANLLNISLSGGLETAYDQNKADNVFSRFSLLNRYYGVNASVNFPKFLVPFHLKNTRRNLPRTILSVGTNFQDRINYFTLTNTTTSIIYNFRETREKTWEYITRIRQYHPSAPHRPRFPGQA